MRAWRIGFVLALLLGLALLVVWTEKPSPSGAPVADSPATPPQLTLAESDSAAAEEPPTVEISAPKRGTLRGRVIDAATGDPIREFEIQFHGRQSSRRGEELPAARTFESKDGRFEWPDLLADTWMVTARASGYQRFELLDLLVPKTGTMPEIMFPLRRGNTLRGRIFDEATGVGIAGASISFRESDVGRFEGNFRIRPRVTTGKNGSFALEGVPFGRVTLQISANGYAAHERVVVAEHASPLQIGLLTGGTIAGRLTAMDGTPLAGSAGVFNLDHGYGGSSRTSETGEFSISHLPPGRYQVTGQSEGGIAEPQEILLGKNEHIDGIVLAVGAGRSIRGFVRGVGPEERSSVRVSVLRDDDVSGSSHIDVGVDEQGSYAVHGVQPGRVRVRADVPMRRKMSKMVDVPADADITVDFEFPSGARLSGRVTRAGRPLANIWLEAHPVVPKLVSGSALTSMSGDYLIEGLALAEYRVRVGERRAQSIQLSGDTVLDFDLSDVRLSGRVLEAAGKTPVVGAHVDIWSARQKSPPVRLQDRTDHFGHFELLGLEPGDFVLTVHKPGYEMLREKIAFSTPVTEMTLRMRAEPGVEIRAHDEASGRGLDELFVAEKIGQRPGIGLQIHLDENGVGYLPEALAGSELSISCLGYVPAVIQVWDGKPLELRFRRQ